MAGGPLVLFALGTVWFSDRRLSAFLAGSSFTLGLAFCALKLILLTSPQVTALVATIITSIVLAALGGGVSTAIDAALRASCITFLAQDGTRCPGCAYPCLSHSPSHRCPECGTLVSEISRRQDRRARAIAFLNRRSPYLLAFAVAVVLSPTIILVMVSAGRFERFTQWAGQLGGQEVSSYMLRTGRHRTAPDWRCSGTLLPVPADSSKLLLLTYAPHVLGPRPVMQARLVWKYQPNPAFPVTCIEGLPPILCNLSSGQADALIKDGVPATLYGDMLEASKAAGWPSALPLPGPGGFITWSGSWPAEPVVISADGRF